MPAATKPPAVVEGFRNIVLGEKAYTLRRMTTRDGLAVAKRILGYTKVLAPLIEQGSTLSERAAESESTALQVGLDFLAALADVIEEDDLIDLGSRILGIPAEEIALAPIEDTLNAIADAFEINDMPALLKAANRIWQGLQRYTQ